MAQYTSTGYGPPKAGFFALGDQVVDAAGVTWDCVMAGKAVHSGIIESGTAVFVAGARGAGTPGTGVVAAEYGDAKEHTTVLTLNTTLGAIAGGAFLGLGNLLYTLPAGVQLVKSAYMSVAITQTQAHITNDQPDVGLGTVVASGAVQVLDGTATFENILTGVTATDCNGTASVSAAKCTASPFELVRLAADAKTIYFNAAYNWAASGDAAAILTGTVVLKWATLN
jgi:hypothetical protein